MRYLPGILILMAALCGAMLTIGWSAETKKPSGRSASEPATLHRASQSDSDPRDHYRVGASGCAATACHGSLHADPRASGATSTKIRRDEYILWSDRDPHARSLQSLQKPPGRAMLAKLGIRDVESGQILDQRGYDNCLACHATPVTDPVTKTVEHESVSCEACHGSAEKWRDTHYQAGWKRNAHHGFSDLKIVQASDVGKLAVRAESCAGCHVGGAGEVNHDLIAAGHPVLKFELAAYHDLLPKHWNDARERAAIDDFEVALWSAGQKATLKQSLHMLFARDARQHIPEMAELSLVRPVWPEFAEFDCYACHHGLTPSPWREAAGADPNVPVPWNTWNLGATDAARRPAVDALRQRMNANPRAGRELFDSINAARKAIEKHDFAADFAMPTSPAARWDDATQIYLQLAARFRARQDRAGRVNERWPEEAETQTSLRAMRQLLVFEGDRNAPSTSGGPAEFEKLRQQIERLLVEGGR